jgi:hypothetical protein
VGLVTDYVKADLDALGHTASRLGQVADRLSRARASADQDAHVVGHPGLAGALTDFSDNWRIRRENLADAVKGAHTFVSGACTAYQDLDKGLADAATPDGKGK